MRMIDESEHVFIGFEIAKVEKKKEGDVVTRGTYLFDVLWLFLEFFDYLAKQRSPDYFLDYKIKCFVYFEGKRRQALVLHKGSLTN